MGNQPPPRKFSWAAPVVAAVVAVGVAYGTSEYLGSQPDDPHIKTEATSTAPAAPPKVEFLGAAMPANASDDAKQAAELGIDDAMIVWMKVTPAAGADARGSMPQLGLKDEKGRDFSVSPRRAGDNMVALHIKKGYDTKPQFLQLTAKSGDKEIGSWKIENIPAPKIVLADSTLSKNAPGIVNLQEGRGGQLGGLVKIKPALPAGQGMILSPTVASYTAIDASRMRAPLMIAPGTTDFEGRLPLPNAAMARRVAFDTVTFEGTTTTATATFKTARIENRFGQPTLVVDKDEMVTLSDGTIVTLPAQNAGPRRQPKHIHPEVSLQVLFDASKLGSTELPAVQPSVTMEIVSPAPSAIGLEKYKVMLAGSATRKRGGGAASMGGSSAVSAIFAVADSKPATAKGGAFKFGPVPLTLRFTMVRPKVISRGKLVLAVDPKPLPAPARGGGGGISAPGI